MPKCLTASRVFLFPRNRMVLEPVGARRASWSSVRISPPAFRIRSFAAAVKRRAAIVSFGTSNRRTSSVTVPTVPIVFESRSGALDVSLTMREREMGGRLILERKRRWRIAYIYSVKVCVSSANIRHIMTLLNAESVRRAKKRYN